MQSVDSKRPHSQVPAPLAEHQTLNVFVYPVVVSQLPIAQPPVPELRQLVRSWPLQCAAIASFALYLHSLFWWTEPRDLQVFLNPWYQHLVRYGPVEAFAHPFSNYTPAYLYLLSIASLAHRVVEPMFAIKTLSVVGNLFAVWAVADLIKSCGGRPRHAWIIIAVPSIVTNAALLAQCDALWAGACVLAISAMISGKTTKSLLWCGVAVAFKAQAAFIAPFIVGALIGHRKPIWQWIIPPAVFVGMMLPAWLVGWPAWELAMVYPGQAAWGDFPSRLANPWMLGTVYAPEAARQAYWVGFAAAALASLAIGILSSKAIRNPKLMLLLAMLSALALPFFLPKMLERYFFLAGLISIAMAASFPSRATLVTAIAIELASLLSLLTYMYFFADPYPTLIGLLFAAGALGMLITGIAKAVARTGSTVTQPIIGRSSPCSRAQSTAIS